MRSNSIGLIIKAYVKRICPLMLMAIAVTVGVGFLCGFHTFGKETMEKELTAARERYGSYQFCVVEQNIDILREMAMETGLDESCIITTKQISWEYGEIYIYHGDKTIFQMLPYQLVKGRFPVAENEILCDGNFLRQLGVEQEDLERESTIAIEGEQYKICGLIQNNTDESNSYINEYSVIMAPEKNMKRGDIYVQTNTADYKKIKEAWTRKYQIQEGFLYDNETVLNYVGINDSGDFTGVKSGVFVFLKILLYITVFLFLSFMFVLCRKKYEDIEKVLQALGIARYVSNFIFIILEFSIFVASFVLLRSVHIYHWRSMWAMALLLVGFTIFCDLSVFFPRNKSRGHKMEEIQQSSLKNNQGGRVKDGEKNNGSKVEQKCRQKGWQKGGQKISVLMQSKNIYRSVARQNRLRQKGRNFIFVFLSVFGIIVLSLAGYCLNLIYNTADEKNYDYQLEFKYKDMVELESGKEEYGRLYEKIMEKSQTYEAFPLFYDFLYVTVDKECVSKEQKDYLKRYSQNFFSEDYNTNKDFYTLQIMIISGELEEIKKMFGMNFRTEQLLPGECIAISKIKNISGNMYKNGMKPQYDITARILQGDDMEKYNIEIKETSQYMNMFLSEGYDMPVVILNGEDYKKLTRKSYPPIIFLNGRKEQVQQEILGLSGAVLTDLHQERKELDNLKKENQRYIQIVYLSFFLSICVQIAIILYDQYFSFKKFYRYLYVIGLSEKQIFRIYWHQNVSLQGKILILGSILSVLLTYMVRFLWGSEIYIKYTIPWKEVGIPVSFVCVLICLVQVSFFLFFSFSLSCSRMQNE